MPSVPKTSAGKIVAAARRMVQKGGVDALSMQAVARSVGVQAPSLYKHFADRAALVGAVRTDVAAQMRDLAQSAMVGDSRKSLRAFANAMRDYAQRAPHLYDLVMTTRPGADLSPADNQAMVAPLLEVVHEVAAPKHALESARLLCAFVHGFVQMELAGAFRLGGDIDAAFDFGLTKIIDSIATR